MDINTLIGGVFVSLISYGLIELLKKYVGFKVKAWLLPIAFFIGFIISPYIFKLFESDKLEIVTGITYDNETVDTSKKEFVRCTFNNCKLIYRGHPTNFTACNFRGRTYMQLEGVPGKTIGTLNSIYNAGGTYFKYSTIEILNQIAYPDKVFIVNEKNDTLSIEEVRKRL